MAGVIARVPSHFTVAARRSRTTDGLPPRESEAIGPLIRGTRTAHLYVIRVPHPEADPIGYYRTVAERFEAPQTSRARQTVALLLGYGERQEQKRRDRERGLRGVAALVGTRLGVGSFVSWTLLLARINLLPPPLAPPLVRHPTPSLPRPSPPPSLAKRGFESPPVLAAASCCRCNKKPERRRMRTLLITLVVLYAPEPPPSVGVAHQCRR